MVLTLDLIKRLRSERKPVGFDDKGAIVFEDNPGRERYIVYDAADSAPPGFAVRVGARKTYILRRKVNGRSVQPTVGNVADFPDLAAARAKAAKLALQIVESGGANPNEQARKIAASEITLGQAFEAYRLNLTTRANKRAKPNTLKVFDRAVRRFEQARWNGRRVRDLSSADILSLFAEGRGSPSANEQNFRWASVAVTTAIAQEALDAATQGRPPTLSANPFTILKLRGMYRSRDQLENERAMNRKRNPLGPTTTLGKFLEVAWSKRRENDNATGIDFILLMLLWGCRKSEHAGCVWGEFLTEDERKTTSHVWLRDEGEYGPYVLLCETKNGLHHRLPLVGMAKTLVERRQAMAAQEAARRGFDRNHRRWVFPARSPFSKRGHYSDASELLSRVREEAGIECLTPHDLRRSFGAVLAALDVPAGIQQRFLNHVSGRRGEIVSAVTASYTQSEWELLKQWMQRVEQAILLTAPNIFNSLKPADWPPLAAPEPHACKPPKPRSGRPRKAALSQPE